MLEARSLEKTFGSTPAVRGLSFRVEGPGLVGLVGPNGSGKTTTMRLLVGFFPPNSGQVLLDGQPLTDPHTLAHRIGYLPEVPPLYPEMSVGRYLEFVARLKGLSVSAARAKVEQVVERLDLDVRHHMLIHQLSRGTRQRVGLAQALVHEPAFLILDEPTSGLDPVQVEEARRIIRDAGQRALVMLSTHSLAEASRLCSRVLVMREGRLAGEIAPAGSRTRVFAITIRGSVELARRRIAGIQGVRECSRPVAGPGQEGETSTLQVEVDGDESLAALSREASQHPLSLLGLCPIEPDLELEYRRLQGLAGEGAAGTRVEEST